MSIPVNQDKRIFQFKTAPLHDGEGHSSLECVHQGSDSLHVPHSQDQLSCWGITEHRLTVQGTDEVYVRTKQQVKEAEKLRKEQRTQEIKPQSRTKSTKTIGDRVSPVPAPFRKPNRPKPVTPNFTKPIMTSNNKPSGLSAAAKPHPSQLATSDFKVAPKVSSRSTYSLKDRVIHILALKPHSREHIVARLKKATKRSENAMTNLDSILDEVSEISIDGYKLKSHFLKNLEVDQWPFYHNAEKQMLKRAKNIGDSVDGALYEGGGGGEQPSSSSSSSFSKRPNLQQHILAPSKKQKLVHQPSSSESPLTKTLAPPPTTITTTTITTTTTTSASGAVDDNSQVESSSEIVVQPKHVEMGFHNSEQLKDDNDTINRKHENTGMEPSRKHENTGMEPSNSRKHENTGMESSRKHTSTSKNKTKKKKKKKREDVDVVASDPTSTSFTPDHISQFPRLSCDEERYRYKQIFNKEYDDYLQLKESIDQVSNQYQKECSALSERLNSVIKHSDEYMEVKRLIQDKYREFQRNRSFFENKNKFGELHQKLDHIKQMVLDYDSRQRES